jgi:protein-tyrosine-phosphatase
MKPIYELRAREREARIRARHAAFLGRPRAAMPARILFLCYGNICRSPFAAGYWNALRLRPGCAALPEAVSAGYYPEENRPTPAWLQALALEHGVSLAAHRSHSLTGADVQAADLIFVMDHQNERALLEKFPEAREKALYLGPFAPGGPAEIEDPFLAGEEAAQQCYRGIVAALEGLASALPGRRDP